MTMATATEKVLITRKHCLSEHSLWVKELSPCEPVVDVGSLGGSVRIRRS